MSRAFLLGCFLVSGLSGLLYEVVWTRVAGTVIGNTTYAIGTVVGVFMGGLAAGAWWGGRAADRRSGGDLVRLYGFLELGVAASAVAVPYLIWASEPIFRTLWQNLGDRWALYAALRVILVGAVLVVPTTLMGATLPVLSRSLASGALGAAREAGLAYAINTLGGVAGTLLSGFWLIPTIGLRATTLLAVALNASIGALAVLWARGTPGEAPRPLAAAPVLNRAALWVSALSGVASLIYEVAWTRSLVISMGSTVYAFTLILSVFILGLGAGSAVSSQLVLRFSRPDFVLLGIQAAIGLFAVFLLPSLGDLPVRIAPIIDQYRQDYGKLLWAEFGIVGLFVFIPTFLIGSVFPFTFRLASRSEDAVGRSVAAVYTWNTVGSIAGTLLGSFVLVPLLGLSSSIRVGASLNILAAAILLGPRLVGKAAALPLALWGIVWLAGGSWDPLVVSSGAYLYGDRAKQLGLDLRKHIQTETTLLAQYWDAYGLTTVHRDRKRGSLSIRVNGKADASTSTDDMPTQRAVGYLGLLHRPGARRVLVIGLGSGVTLGAVAEHPADQVDCVEISPAGVKAASFFEEANGHVLSRVSDPRGHLGLRVGDGRNAVQFAARPYDVIVSQPSNLWISGMANLFTRDYFQVARERLAPGGLYCQWVQAYRLPLPDFQAILRTFFSVFPHGSLWEVSPGQDYLMLGSLTPFPIGFRELGERLKTPGLGTLFEHETYPRAVAVLGHFIAEASAVRASLGDSPLLSDDLPSIEYSTSRVMFTYLEPRTLRWLDDLRALPLPADLYPGLDPGPVAESHDFRRRVARVVAFEAERPPAHRVLERLAQEAPAFGLDPEIRHHFDDIAYLARLEAKNLRLSARLGEARKVLSLIPRRSSHYPDSLQERAQLCRLQDRLEEAERCLRELLSDYPGSFPALIVRAALAEQDRHLEAALARWRDAVALREDSEDAQAHLASCLARMGRSAEARAAARRALDLDPSQALALQVLRDLDRP